MGRFLRTASNFFRENRALTAPIDFIDLQAQRRRLGENLNAAVLKAVSDGKYILGPQVIELEKRLSEFAGVKHTVTCANGTDALMIILRAWDIGPGDAVFVPAFTFAASAEVVALVGASPVFVDVLEDTYNIDPASLEAAIAMVKRDGKLKPRVVMPVDLFGQPADYKKIEAICTREKLLLLCDSAQGFGGKLNGRVAGGIGDAATTSFFPAKPLGCYGDGGAVLTDDDKVADLLRSIRVHGQGSDKYDNVRIGLASRLDTVQAAVLSEKLKIFPDEIEARDAIAKRYAEGLHDVVTVPSVPADLTSVWAQYTIRVSGGRRDALAAALKAEGIPTAIYYPIPLHRQIAYKQYPIGRGGLAVSDRLAGEVISLPMHPYLDQPTQARIVDATRRALT